MSATAICSSAPRDARQGRAVQESCAPQDSHQLGSPPAPERDRLGADDAGPAFAGPAMRDTGEFLWFALLAALGGICLAVLS